MKIEFSVREERKYFVSEMFNFVIVTFIDGSLGEVSIKSTVANRNSSQENCTNSLQPNSKFYILNLTYLYNIQISSSLYYCKLHNKTTKNIIHYIDISTFLDNTD